MLVDGVAYELGAVRERVGLGHCPPYLGLRGGVPQWPVALDAAAGLAWVSHLRAMIRRAPTPRPATVLEAWWTARRRRLGAPELDR